ncbi:MAG: hypothetical protein ACFE9Z_07260 [Promethearchaeota archaeon]
MAWVPIIVNNRRNRNYRSSGAGIIIGLVIFFLMFGVIFFIFFDNFNGYTPPIWIMVSGFGGFLLIIAICLVITGITSQASKKPIDNNQNPYLAKPQELSRQLNPYNVNYNKQKLEEESKYTKSFQEEPVVLNTNYCRFCGSKIEGEAIYCHQCGTKL